MDFSFCAQPDVWQLDACETLLRKHPNLKDIKIKQNLDRAQKGEQKYAQIQMEYQKGEQKIALELSFHVERPPVLGSSSMWVDLPLPKTYAQFQLEPNAIAHLKQRRLVISQTQFDQFLNKNCLHFMMKQIALRMNEEWKLPKGTVQLFEHENTRAYLQSVDADLPFRIFLTSYVRKQLKAYFTYFQDAPAACHVLLLWLSAFGVPEQNISDFQRQIGPTLKNKKYPLYQRYQQLIQHTLQTILEQGHFDQSTYVKRLLPILEDLQKRLRISVREKPKRLSP